MCAGDVVPNAGLWRVNASGTDLEPIVTNGMLDSSFLDAPRAIGFIPFENYLAWASDSSTNPYIFRMARTEIGKPQPKIERMYKLNSTAWWSCKASDDGKTWVISASNEFDGSIDNQVHLYAVTDEGETVWEVATIPTNSNSPAGSLMPISTPELHGDDFYLTTRGFDDKYTWHFNLGMGFGSVVRPTPRPPYNFTQTINTNGEIELQPNEEFIMGTTRTSLNENFLYVFELYGHETDEGGVSPATRVFVRVAGESEELLSLTTWRRSYRSAYRYNQAMEVLRQQLPNNTTIEFGIRNAHGSATKKVMAHVVFANAHK